MLLPILTTDKPAWPAGNSAEGFLRSLLFAVLLISSLSGCSQPGETDFSPQQVEAKTPDRLFELLPSAQTGIDFVGQYPEDSVRGRKLLATAFTGGGVCVGDYDADGLPDVYLTRRDQGCCLFRNLGDWKFQDVTEQAGVSGNGHWCTGATFADLNNDGLLDLYVGVYHGANRFYLNTGNGSFQEKANEFNLDYIGGTVMPSIADYDCDGDLDVYLLTNQDYDSERARRKEEIQKKTQSTGNIAELFDIEPDGKITGVKTKYQDSVKILRDSAGLVRAMAVAESDRLLRNDGNATFTDVTGTAGMGNEAFFGLSATWWDSNNDGWPDLYVANDFTDPDILYRNNGDGTFSDITKESLPHTPWYSMGSAAGDINNDGLVDFVATDMAGTSHFKQKIGMGDMSANGWFLTSADPRQYMRNAVYLNTGTDRFMEVAYLTGLSNTDWTWSPKLADLDNDGWIDLFATNGMSRDFFNSDLQNRAGGYGITDEIAIGQWLTTEPKRDRNLAFRNQGDLRFENVSQDWGLGHLGVSYGAAVSDLDRDGDLDLIVNNYNEQAGVYRNLGTGCGNYAAICLQGVRSNKNGVGARLQIESAAGIQTRQIAPCSGFMSADEPIAHFGLGIETEIRRLTIRWPSGVVQTMENLEANRYHTVEEPTASTSNAAQESRSPGTTFRSSDQLCEVMHRESPFDDFEQQPLLPGKLSQLGPGMAWGDFDGDGDDDFFIGGASGQSGQLFRNDKGVLINQHPVSKKDAGNPFESDRGCEDLGAVFFDADVDGDLDLFVVSGGVEHGEKHALLQDRLYLNDGSGLFAKAPANSLPDVQFSGSVVAAADFDRDGDVDLFVGGRVIPGRYPEVPISSLLRNDSTTGGNPEFRDVTNESLRHSGLVTSAIWSDADGDDWPDLLVTHEWGPVKFYRNDNGQLRDQTADAGLLDQTGWWNGIAARDIDNDGDIDYAVTNLGLNTKYHASHGHPAMLYYGDFDDSGRKHLVEAEYEGQTLYPVRGRSCSSNAMPVLDEKIKSFEEFAVASLLELYRPQFLDDALQLRANTFESGVLINDGNARFTFQALPRIAQVAPAYGVLLTELDGDGRSDIIVANNFFGPQPETGRMDGGVSLLLLGNGNGTFTPQWPSTSGLVVAGDAKSLTTTDINGDGQFDLVVGVNNDCVKVFENTGLSENRLLVVRLKGNEGNPTAIGSRVSVDTGLQTGLQTAEVTAGGGYLSQSSCDLVFGCTKVPEKYRIFVRWPDGESTVHDCDSDSSLIQIDRTNTTK